MINNNQFQVGLVSCLSPVYNGAKWVRNLLDSLLAQTYEKMEIIIVDDGSKDNSVEIINSYKDKFEKKGYSFIVIQAEHRSASGAINQGLKHVTGQYLIWPDSDDVLEADSVEKRVKALINTNADAVRSLSYYFDNDTKQRVNDDEKRGDLTQKNLFFPILESKTFVCCGCYMLRSELFFEIYPGRRIPEYDVGQNFQMLLPYMYKHECLTVNEELYGVCVHDGSHSRRKLTKKQELKKYRDYEKLINDIAVISGIYDKSESRQIELWKLNRRRNIANKYNIHSMKILTYIRRLMLKDANIYETLKSR